MGDGDLGFVFEIAWRGRRRQPAPCWSSRPQTRNTFSSAFVGQLRIGRGRGNHARMPSSVIDLGRGDRRARAEMPGDQRRSLRCWPSCWPRPPLGFGSQASSPTRQLELLGPSRRRLGVDVGNRHCSAPRLHLLAEGCILAGHRADDRRHRRYAACAALAPNAPDGGQDRRRKVKSVRIRSNLL